MIHNKHLELAKQHNISIQQYHLLLELDALMLDIQSGYIAPTINEVAKIIRKTQNTTSEKLSRLEKKGLVKKIKDNDDKRITRVLLTDEGRILINSISNEASNNFLYASLEKMDECSINALLTGIQELVKHMK